MQDELDKMDKYKVWEVVPASPGQRVVGAKWVYSRKIDGDTGKPSKYKARWVAKGYSCQGGGSGDGGRATMERVPNRRWTESTVGSKELVEVEQDRAGIATMA